MADDCYQIRKVVMRRFLKVVSRFFEDIPDVFKELQAEMTKGEIVGEIKLPDQDKEDPSTPA